MDQWNGNVRVPRPAHESPFSFLYNCNYDHFPVLEMKQPLTMQATTPPHQHPPLFPTIIDNKQNQLINGVNDMMNMDPHMIYENSNNMNIYHNDPKKKRLSNEQLESLENSFQEEIKLDPERKQRLAKELGLQPRQIAVWFQNRRARWKAKQLERLYDVLKQEYDAVSKEKHKLQQEVLALRAILKDQVVMGKKHQQVSTEISNDETVESTSIPCDNKPPHPMMNTNNITNTDIIINNNDNNNNNSNGNKQIADQSSNYALDDYNHVMMAPYNNWAAP